MELAKQLAHEQECTDGCNSIGNPAVSAVDKDALIRKLMNALWNLHNGTPCCDDAAEAALVAASEAGYLFTHHGKKP